VVAVPVARVDSAAVAVSAVASMVANVAEENARVVADSEEDSLPDDRPVVERAR
jgi:hypothetical protein